MPIITPDGLEADAVVPQCLDNQFVTAKTLTKLIKCKDGFGDAKIQALRHDEVHAEFLRSLIYASQVVVNRAYFAESHYLNNHMVANVETVAQLIEKGAIVPYLFNEHTFGETLARFKEHKDSFQKLLTHLAITPDAKYVRLAMPSAPENDKPEADSSNKIAIARMAADFKKFCLDFQTLDLDIATATAKQLYSDTGNNLIAEVPDGIATAFREQLVKIGQFSNEKSNELYKQRSKDIFGRTHIYEEFFCKEGTHYAKGIYKPELKPQTPLWMAMKLIDLKYNAGLPDELQRYTLTPASLPSRSALPYSTPGTITNVNECYRMLRGFANNVIDNFPALVLPALKQLQLKDVLEIRTLPSWKGFSDAQAALLRADPVALVEAFMQYKDALQAFQQEFSDWSNRFLVPRAGEAGLQRVKRKVQVVLTRGSLVATLTHHHGVGLALDGLNMLAGIAGPYVRGAATVKLYVQAHDAITNKIAPDHTYCVELVKLVDTPLNELQEMVRQINNNFSWTGSENPAELANR